MLFFCRNFVDSPTREPCLFLTRDFFVRQVKNLEGYIIICICREGFGLYNGKDPKPAFWREIFLLGGFYSPKAIFIYAEGDKIRFAEKDTIHLVLTRDFFVRQFKDSAADMNIGKEALGCITEKDPSKKVKKAENGHYFTVQSLPSPFHI